MARVTGDRPLHGGGDCQHCVRRAACRSRWNVERVLQRVSGKRLAEEELWSAANHLLDTKRPGDFNQAMMELGAVVCTPRAPACLTCPVIELCATRGELAAETKAKKQKKREIHYALHYRNGDVLL